MIYFLHHWYLRERTVLWWFDKEHIWHWLAFRHSWTSRTSNASSLLQWRSHRMHKQPQIPWDPCLQNAHIQDTGQISKTRAKKGLSTLKAMSAKGNEQCHVFLLYQSVILCVIDHAVGLPALSQPNLLQLKRVQSEAIRVILGTTEDTSIEAMRYLLDLPPIETRNNVVVLCAGVDNLDHR